VGVTERRERRRKQLLDDLTEKRGYWKLEEGILRRSLWRIHFELVRQTTKWMNTFSVVVRLEGRSGSVIAPNYAVCCVVKPWWRFAYVLKINFFLFFSRWACFYVQLSIYKTRFTRILFDNFDPVIYSRSLKPWNSVRVWSRSWAFYRCFDHVLHHSLFQSEAGRASLVYRIATGWTVRCSNPGGREIFRNLPHPPCTVGTGSLSRG
jgi:hypothetical protein